ncbi:hypothetical protein RD792_015268 [Penstemon davidsonii]|uniref:Formin-like protein n=1 Tax=Penstemon davidsonii TaxID=160366 RepID=A0ABR0CT97_9LAMI|nr:hypothetical protein RD792_015268 [Penstemon davidsonii]
MAAFLKPSTILSLFILLIIFSIPQSYSQLTSPQNIQIFYPFSTPPRVILLTPPPPPATTFHPPTTLTPLLQPPSPPLRLAAVGKAIGATAASTLILSGLLFFFLQRRSSRKREREINASTTNRGIKPFVPPPQDDNFTRFDGKFKGVIVDGNGLDVLHWRSLEEGDNKTSFKNLNYEEKEEDKSIVEPKVQEVALLRGKSSISQSLVWGEKQENAISFKVEDHKQNSSIQLMNMSTQTFLPPPPPPPPPPVPPPPPGTVALASSLKPPPPKGTPKKIPSSSLQEGKGNGQVKFKPLHWDKVNPNPEHSMVWDKIEKGSFKFDGDLMEALFGYVATNRNPKTSENSISPREDKQSEIFILDTRKSQNIAIVLKSLSVTQKEITQALVKGHGLNSDTIEKLTKIALTDEESSEILDFEGDPTRLSYAESFLYHLLKAIPSAFTRFNAMLFRSNYDLEVSHLKESLQTIESACNELRTRGLFLKLLEAVLKAGNRLNEGTLRGNAQAFNLTALTKLSDVKGSDGKTTLLQFVVQEVIRAEGKRSVLNKNRCGTTQISKDDGEREYIMLGLPSISGLSGQFLNVKKAALFDYDLLLKTSSNLGEEVIQIRKMVERCGTSNGGFVSEMNGFLEKAELEIKVVKEEQNRVMEFVKKTTEYYQAGSLKDKGSNFVQLFVIVRDFLTMVDEVCIDIARNVQKRRSVLSSVAGGSMSPDDQSFKVFRFPNLSDNFMSDSSKSSSSDSDDDSDLSL